MNIGVGLKIMMKGLIGKISVVLVLLGCNFCYAKTKHANKYNFINSDGEYLELVNVKDGKIVASAGQPTGDIEVKDGNLIVWAGRHHTQELTDEFNKNHHKDNYIGYAGYGTEATNLNFYATFESITLKLADGNDVTLKDAYVAQGYVEKKGNYRNVWWFGSKHCHQQSLFTIDKRINCYVTYENGLGTYINFDSRAI